MTLYSKCILAPISPEDGTRISVMSRHTLNDGKTPDPRITHDLFQEHLTIFAPPVKLIGAYYKRGLPWEEFEKQYRAYLQEPETQQHVAALAERALNTDITIMCIEETPEHCHRRLLAEHCKTLIPALEIIIR